MAANQLIVILGDRVIGEINRSSKGALSLRFDRDYVDDYSATPMSVSMPQSESQHNDAKVVPWLWGLLPDNADVIARWGREFSVSTSSPFSLLGSQVGLDCAGAVQFCSEANVSEVLARSGNIDVLDDRGVADRLRALRSDSSSWLGAGFTGQFSLAGAQAKTALHYSNGEWGVPTGSTPTTHILKPAMAGLVWQDLNEHLCLAAANEAGLPAADTSIMVFEDETAIVVKRFDRVVKNGELVRVHQEDLCQALSVYPERKYQAEGGPTPGRLADLIRASMRAADAERDVWRLLDALAFNWLVAGTDAHAKNYGFVHSGPRTRLASLYDVASYLPYDTSNGHDIKLAMKIGADYRLKRTDRRRAWEATAKEMKLNPSEVVERVSNLAQRLPAAFELVAGSSEVVALGTDFADRLVELVTRRCEHCVQILA